MFERRNQSILTPHYSALVSHDDDEDEVFTLARKDHALADEDDELAEGDLQPGSAGVASDEPLISSEDLSKRKLKAGLSKKAILKNRPAAEKLVFDEAGNATNFYESGAQAELGAGDVAARKEFLEKERAQMREADKVDRAVARDAKREKKRKRKEREKEVSESDNVVAAVSLVQADRQLAKAEQAEFDEEYGGGVAVLGGESDYSDAGAPDESDEEPAPALDKRGGKRQKVVERDVEDEEALALRLLQGN